MNMDSINYEVLEDFKETFVVPTSGASVLRSLVMLRTGTDVPTSIQLLINGEVTPILKWHEPRGYAGVPEFALKKLVTTIGCPDIALENPNMSAEDKCVIQLTKHCNPKVDDTTMIEILTRRNTLE